VTEIAPQPPTEPSPPPAPRPWPLAPEPEPPFGLLEVLVVLLAVFAALFLAAAAAFVAAHFIPGLRQLPPAKMGSDPRLLLPAQLAAYLLVFALIRRYLRHLGKGVREALLWRWPARWLGFLWTGALLGIVLIVASQWIAQPPRLPIDEMFRTRAGAWLLSSFGVLVAPFAEELFFRGLLFPALARRVGLVLSVLLTSLAFGATHAMQLGGAWEQIAMICLVGLALTLVRWRTHSLACSTLVHIGYNAVIFATLLAQTRGFTRIPNF